MISPINNGPVIQKRRLARPTGVAWSEALAKMKPLFTELFYHDGRGPELVSVRWMARGQVLEAIEFMPPDASSPDDICHLFFTKLQVVQIIPEEVISYGTLNDALIAHRPAALFDAGRTEWLKSFSQMHLSRCTHYKALFYDELFEVIAEGVKVAKGKYERDQQSPEPTRFARG